MGIFAKAKATEGEAGNQISVNPNVANAQQEELTKVKDSPDDSDWDTGTAQSSDQTPTPQLGRGKNGNNGDGDIRQRANLDLDAVPESEGGKASLLAGEHLGAGGGFHLGDTAAGTRKSEADGPPSDRSDNGRKSMNGDSPDGRRKEKPNDKTKNERGRAAVVDRETMEKNELLINSEADPPAAKHALPNFTGEWICSSTDGEWDEYLFLLNVPLIERKMAKARNFGKGYDEQHIIMPPDKNSISITNPSKKISYTTGSDRDASRQVQRIKQEALPINGEPCMIRQGVIGGVAEGKVTLTWEGNSLMTRGTMTLPDGQEAKYLLKRYMLDYLHMRLDLHVRHVVATRTFIPLEEFIPNSKDQ